MKLTPLGIEGLWVAESPVWSDERGLFREWFKSNEIRALTGIEFEAKQANLSMSNRGVIRGIHYSLADDGQAKWITCANGHVLDVIVDIRPSSPTFKEKVLINLKGGEGKAILVSSGLGHGFLALEDNSIVSYLLSSTYSPGDEYEINPMDREINIDWSLSLVDGSGHIISPKDAKAPSLAERLAEGKLPQK
jgi:dTDP-4-dehydrorhamnose 3,5-epimerase